MAATQENQVCTITYLSVNRGFCERADNSLCPLHAVFPGGCLVSLLILSLRKALLPLSLSSCPLSFPSDWTRLPIRQLVCPLVVIYR